MKIIGLGFGWEELSVGDKFRTVGRTITEADLTSFLGLTSMNEVIFTDDLFRAKHSVIKEKFVPGALAYVFAEGLLIPTMQGTGLAFLNMDLSVHQPIKVGDTIHVEVEVLAVRKTSKSDRGIVKTKNEIKNQDGDILITYTPQRMMKSVATRDGLNDDY